MSKAVSPRGNASTLPVFPLRNFAVKMMVKQS